jgi:deoxyribonuclease V
VRIANLHPWRVSPSGAAEIQARLASRVIREGEPAPVRFVAGADIALPRGRSRATAAVVVLSYPDLVLVERHAVEEDVTFPYVPGLLAFREVPVLARALERLSQVPDLLLVDGQGYSHPRRFGLACHLGLLLDLPTIGVAKSRLIGAYDEPAPQAGARAELRDGDEVVGLVLRTRERVTPLFVSVGHRVGLAEAVDWTLRLCRGYRLPEPTRLADKLSKGRLAVP